MPKPIATVLINPRGGRACIEVWTPDTDADKAHREAAIAAAVATSDWCEAALYGVYVCQPTGGNFTRGALREMVTVSARTARDAAKASLRAAGYTVRAK